MIKLATEQDLNYILNWLRQEYLDDADSEYGPEGFWCNRQIIERSLSKDLWVYIHDDAPVAFQVGNYSPDILNVKKDYQRRGFGQSLFQAGKIRAYQDDINALNVLCMPRRSFSFWQKLGFERYGHASDYDEIKMALVLERKFMTVASENTAAIKVCFYSEEALYQENVAPIDSYSAIGRVDANGTVHFESRMIGRRFLLPNGKDLAVKILIEGVEKCFCKAKYPLAKDIGLEFDWHGNVFYLDKINSDSTLA